MIAASRHRGALATRHRAPQLDTILRQAPIPKVITVVERNPTRSSSLAEAVERGADRDCRLWINHSLKRAAVQIPPLGLTLNGGEVVGRVRQLRQSSERP